MSRYTPSRHYLTVAVASLAGAALTLWMGFHWLPSLVLSVLLFLASGLAGFLALRPPIEIHPHHLRVGDNVYPWSGVQAVDRTGWVSPLVLFLTLTGGERKVLVFPGSLESTHQLLRHIRRSAHEAVIDGISYDEFWGQPAAGALPEPEMEPGRSRVQIPRYPVLCVEDEAEVERLYQRLKAVGHLDSKGSDDN